MADKDCVPSDDKEVAAVGKIIAALLIAMKNSALYPEHHHSYRNSVEKVRSLIENFFERFDYLRLYVENERLLFGGDVVCQDGDILTSVMFRDGILWLEFEKGIESEEIIGFIRLINKYKVLTDISEGDLVTALWDADFEHIVYEAEYAFWKDETFDAASLLSLSTANETEPVAEDRQPEDIRKPDLSASSGSELCGLPPELWELGSHEVPELERMVIKEENEDQTKDVLDVLLIILEFQNSEEEFSTTLDFVEEELGKTLMRMEFDTAHRLLARLTEIKRVCTAEKPWTIPLFRKFFVTLSGPEFLSVLLEIRPMIENAEPENMKSFRKLFSFLLPQAITPIAPLLVITKSPQLRRVLMETIGALASKDIRPLEKLLEEPDEELVRRLVFILGMIKGKKANELLMKMVRHSSEAVRKEALNSLMSGDAAENIPSLFPLIEDDSDSIRGMVLEFLAREKHPDTEKLMLDYLEQRKFGHENRRHIMACYDILGRNGSSESLAFLEKTLFGRPWASLVGMEQAFEREAAASALARMGTEEANSILAKASRNLFPAVRRAYKKTVGGDS